MQCTVVTALCSSSMFAIADPWPQFRGQHRDGKSSETGLWKNIAKEDPKLEWIAEGVGSGYASVSVVDGRVFTTGNSSNAQQVTALSVTDGHVLWTRPISERKPKHSYEGSRSTPTVDGDRLYICGSDGSIVCLNTSTGEPIWRRAFSDWNGTMMSQWGFSESPLVEGDVVVCTPGANDNMMVALNKQTGHEIWSMKMEDTSRDTTALKDGAGYSSIMVSHAGGVKQYVQLVGKGVIGVRASDGELLWRYARVGNKTANIPAVIVAGDNIFCSTGYNTGSALLKLSGKGDESVAMEEVYFLDAKTLQNKHGGMVLVDGHIYCGHGNGLGLPICVELKTGIIKWGPERGLGKGESSVVYADGHLVFRFQDGTISVVKANAEKFEVVRSFKPVFQQKESWSYPAISDGLLYFREQDKIMCYRLK
ncbi:MAG: PQQ-binding-like beta-propeller repeat protein [Pirellulaceae bacterium]|nr:PQQ-binding-like beta-propeller repeat protein [Pirellulaceae bacterium]